MKVVSNHYKAGSILIILVALAVVILPNIAVNADLEVPATLNYLEITPVNDFESSGPAGGPFTPSFKDYQLTNIGLNSLYWGVDKTSDWLDLNPEWGSLDPCESVIRIL